MNNVPSNGKCDGMPANEREMDILLGLKFQQLYPTTEDCWKEIYKYIGPRANRCLNCGKKNPERTHNIRISKCRRCKAKIWITANTFFSRIRVPRAWLCAIWLLEQGIKINASRLHRIAGIAYSTAFAILKKLAIVISSEMDDTISACSSSFLAAFRKRSSKTPADSHPAAEQEQIEAASFRAAENGLEDQTAGCALEKDLQLVYDCLGNTPADADSLCEQLNKPVEKLAATLTLLELEGLAQRLHGNSYVRSSKAKRAISQTSDSDLLPLVATILDFIWSEFHGISRKYLQLYVAMHWYHSENNLGSAGSLLETCAKFRPVKYAEILGYVSPALISIGHQSTSLA
jgi:hypothetical protein